MAVSGFTTAAQLAGCPRHLVWLIGSSETLSHLKGLQAAFSFSNFPFSRVRQSLCVEGPISTKKN